MEKILGGKPYTFTKNHNLTRNATFCNETHLKEITLFKEDTIVQAIRVKKISTKQI